MKAQAPQWATVALAFAVVLFFAAFMPPVEAATAAPSGAQPVEQWKRNPCVGGFKWGKCLPRYADAQPGHDEPLQWKCRWLKRGVRSCKR